MDVICYSINSFRALSWVIHVIWLLSKETIYLGSKWIPDSLHALIFTCYFCKEDLKKSVEKDLRSTQGEGGNNNAQMKYIILFPHVIQIMV